MITKLTSELIASQVVTELYHQFPGTTVTVCCLVLRNGYSTVGESACVDPNNFDEQIGKDLAKKDAMEKIWVLWTRIS